MDSLATEAPQNNGQKENDQYVFTAGELLNRNVKEVPMLLDPIFPQVGLAALAGSSDTGKSALLRDFACAIALGQPDYVGFPLNLRHKKALYVSTEDDGNAICALLHKRKDRALGNEACNDLRFIFDTNLLLFKLEEQLQKERVDCVFIDAFADLFVGDMNASNKVRSFLQEYANIAQRYECLIVFLHHTGKRTDHMMPSKDNLLGSQGFEGKMRMVAELRRDPNNPDIRHLCIVKGNYIPQEYKNASFALHFDAESMTFQNTGLRAEFKNLVKRDSVENNDLQRAKEVALDLHHQQKMTVREIEKTLIRMGLPGKKSAIAEWVKDMPIPPVGTPDAKLDSGKPDDDTDDGETYYDMDDEKPFDD